MATLWIIDAYNFIRGSKRFSNREAENPERGRQEALRWLGRFAEKTGERLRVIFDAYGGYQREPTKNENYSLEIWRSRGSTTADEEIILLAQGLKEACVVVSSDREVQAGAVRAGASILSIPEFEREVARILEGSIEQEDRGYPPGKAKGRAFQVPKEKKKAFQLLRKYR